MYSLVGRHLGCLAARPTNLSTNVRDRHQREGWGRAPREPSTKPEINVGRVQGNDSMLPKGNVSKRHARLLFRDGRVIVTDLKSTNGTYVNGRKIVQATLVREGDKIYVGDFVLRVELSGMSGTPVASGRPGGHSRGALPARCPTGLLRLTLPSNR